VFYGTQYFWRHCSVHNTIVNSLTRFDAAIPRPHCIVSLVFYGLKCGLKYRKMNWNFGLPFMEWVTPHRNQKVSYSLDIRVNSDLSGQLYTKSMPFKISITLSRLLVLYTCLLDVKSSLLLYCLFCTKGNTSTSKLGLHKHQTVSQNAPYYKHETLEFCIALRITTQFLSHIVLALGIRFPVSDILKEQDVFTY